MSTDSLTNAAIATSMALLLLVAGTSIALAKDLQPQIAANVPNRLGSEREIDAIGSKEDMSSATSGKVLYKFKYKNKYGREDYKYDEVRPNPPLPPKDTKGPVKRNVGEAVGLNPQPLPPAGMGGMK